VIGSGGIQVTAIVALFLIANSLPSISLFQRPIASDQLHLRRG
jgi:hypothetical protein